MYFILQDYKIENRTQSYANTLLINRNQDIGRSTLTLEALGKEYDFSSSIFQ